MERVRKAVHRTVIVVDIEGFGDRRRTAIHRVTARAGLYRALQQALGAAGIAWAQCDSADRGDGVLILVPAEVPKSPLVDAVPYALAVALRGHNIYTFSRGAYPAADGCSCW